MSLAAVCATEGYTFKLQVSNNVSKSHKCCVCVVVVFLMDTVGKWFLSHLGEVMRTQTSQHCSANRIYAIPHILSSHFPGLTIIFAKS